MWASRRCAGALLALGLLGAGAAASEPRGALVVYESTLNDLAGALEPLEVNALTPPLVLVETVLCEGDTAHMIVSNVVFRIAPEAIRVTAQARATLCGAVWESPLEGTAQARIAEDGSHLLFETDFEPVQPVFRFVDFEVALPFALDPGPTLSVPSLLLGGTWLELDTPRGARSLHLVADQAELVQGEGFLRIEATLGVY